MARRKMAPIDAKTLNAFRAQGRDNVSTRELWMIVHPPTVTIGKQRDGEHAEWMCEMPIADFNKLARWYVLGIVPRKSPHA